MSCAMFTFLCIGTFPSSLPVDFPSVHVWTPSDSSGENVEYTGAGHTIYNKIQQAGHNVYCGFFFFLYIYI